MKKTSIFSRAIMNNLAILLITFVSFTVGVQQAVAEKYVGATATDFQVSNGNANYSVPINVAPGRGGMQPELSLSYDGGNSNDIVGVGWNLNAVTAVSRCTANLEQDGFNSGVTFTDKDRYCLNGQRLIPIKGVNGGVGTEYRTEIDGYSRIRSVGGSVNNPKYFTVETTAGQVLTFGLNDNSAVEVPQGNYSWSISEINDTTGNNPINYIYSVIDNKQYLDSIVYTGGKVDFSYEVKPDSTSLYVASSKVLTKYRLESISTFYATTPLRKYNLTYNNDSRKSLLSSVQECTEQDKDCLQALEFNWEGQGATDGNGTYGSVKFSKPSTNAVFANDDWSDASFHDANGDGLPDAAWVRLHANGITIAVALALGDGKYSGIRYYTPSTSSGYDDDNWNFAGFHDTNGDGRADAVWTWLHSNGIRIAVSPANADGSYGAIKYSAPSESSGYKDDNWRFSGLHDTNGDGLQDVVWTWLHSNGIRVAVSLAQGDGSYGQIKYSSPSQSSGYRDNGWSFSGLHDANADGLPDIVWTWKGTTGLRVSVSLAEGNGFYGSVKYNVTTESSGYNGDNWQFSGMYDTNNDGQPDAVWAWKGAGGLGVSVSLSEGAGKYSSMVFSKPSDNAGYAGDNWKFSGMHDANNDGLVDAVWTNLSSAGIATSVSLAQGKGKYGPIIFSKPSTNAGFAGEKWSSANMLDTNADGLIDAVWTRLSNVGITVTVTLSQGDGTYGGIRFFKPSENSGYSGDNWEFSGFHDSNGDGLSDAMWTELSSNGIRISGSLAESIIPKISSITDSMGQRIDLEYSTLTDSDVYTKGNDAVYPVVDLQNAMSVVSRMTVDDGVGGTLSTEYHYEGLKAHTRGRGSYGFSKITETYPEKGKTQEYYFDQTGFPFIGNLIRQTESYNGQLLNESNSEYQQTSHYPGVLSVSMSRGVQRSYELNGSMISEVTTLNENIDEYGNIGKVTTTNQGGGETFVNSTINTYTNDASKWHLGRLTRAESAHTTPQGHSTRKLSRFGYNTNTGLLIWERTKSIQTNEIFQTTWHAYDKYGQEIKTTLVVPGEENRVSTTARDALGRPSKTCNALKQCETFSYNEYGLLKNQTGPNSVTTSWLYDDFQRAHKEIRADGSQTETNYYFASSGQCGEAAEHAYYCKVTEVSGSPEVIMQYDRLDREVRSISTALNGLFVYTNTEYNYRGEVTRTSRPYFLGDNIYWANSEYDEIGRVVKLTEPGPHGTTNTITTEYNGLTTTTRNGSKQLMNITVKNVLGQNIRIEEEESGSIDYTYTTDNQLLTTIVGGDVNTTITLAYDERNRKISMDDPDMGFWTYEYDSYGQLVKQTDAKDQVVTTEYDKLGRLTRREEPEGVSTWEYGDLNAPKGSIGKLLVESNDSVSKTYSYDEIGRAVATTYNLEGTSYTERVHFDDIGRVIKTDYPGGQGFYTENLYSDLGFLHAVRGSRSQAQAYDLAQLSPLIEQAVDLAESYQDRAQTLRDIGDGYREKLAFYKTLKATAAVDLDNEILSDLNSQEQILTDQIEQAQALSPEFIGHLNNATIELETVIALIDQEVGSYGELVEQLTVLAEQTLAAADNNFHYQRTIENGIESYQDQIADENHITYWRALDADASGRINAEVYGNGIVNNYTYNTATGQLQVIDSSLIFDAPVRHIEYQYDAYDNVTLRHDLVNDISETYEYDRLDRLTGSYLTSGRHFGDVGVVSQTQTYDFYGNITYKSDVGDYSYNSSRPHAVTNAGNKQYKYDANGNMSQGDGRTYTWSSFNKPTFMGRGGKSARFSYGVDRARYKKVNQDGDTTWYVSSMYEKNVTENGQHIRHQHYIHAAGKMIAIHSVSNKDGVKTQYLHRDALDSIDTITGADAQVIDRRSYDAWGKQRYFDYENGGVVPANNASLLITTKAYTGHESVAEVDLIHMNGRVYDATLARFISADPHIQEGAMSQSYNRYSYVLNNPLKYNDPSGYFFSKLFKKIKKAIKKVVDYLKPYVGIIVGVVLSIACPPCGAVFIGAVAGAASAAVNGGNILKAAIIGGVTAGVFQGIGAANLTDAATIGAHAVAGGTLSVIQGGDFGAGFLSAGFAKFATINLAARGVLNPASKNIGVLTRDTAISAVIGGTASVVGGGKFKNAAKTAAFAYLFNQVKSASSGAGSTSSQQNNPLNVVGSVLGKIWNLPNTIIGLAVGGVGHLAGLALGTNPSITFGNNAIEFTGNPLAAGGALTLGNTIIWGAAKNSQIYNQFSSHERVHTYQGELLGPLYLPAHISAMTLSVLASPFPSTRRNVPGASIAHGKFNFMEGPLFKNALH